MRDLLGVAHDRHVSALRERRARTSASTSTEMAASRPASALLRSWLDANEDAPDPAAPHRRRTPRRLRAPRARPASLGARSVTIPDGAPPWKRGRCPRPDRGLGCGPRCLDVAADIAAGQPPRRGLRALPRRARTRGPQPLIGRVGVFVVAVALGFGSVVATASLRAPAGDVKADLQAAGGRALGAGRGPG